MHRFTTLILFVSACSTVGCQYGPTDAALESKVAEKFEKTIPLSEVVARYNREFEHQVGLEMKHGSQPPHLYGMLSEQPPLTEEEVVTALRVALRTGYEERGTALINGVNRPRPIEPYTRKIIEKILETDRIPADREIEVEVGHGDSQMQVYTYFPTLKLPFNDIVIRQVYISSETEGFRVHQGSSGWVGWLLPDTNRRSLEAEETIGVN